MVSCEYEPPKEYFNDISSTSPFKDISINLMDKTDTIILISYTTFNYNIQLNKGQYSYKTSIFMDDKEINNLGSTIGSFYLISSDFENGSHKLTLKVTTNTGTLSLADHAKAEALVYSRTWTLIVDNSLPKGLAITRISDTNGQVKVEWEKNGSYNFKSYRLFRNVYLSEDYSTIELLATIKNADSTTFIDDSYIGGLVNYYVENSSVDHVLNGPSSSYNQPYSTIKRVTQLRGDSIKICWNRTNYWNNFLRYELIQTNTAQTVLSFDNLRDTTISFKMPFGGSREYKLITYSKRKFDNSNERLTNKRNLYLGDSIPSYQYMVHSNLPDIVYLVQNAAITRYNVLDNKVLNTLPTSSNSYDFQTVCISPDGKILVSLQGQKIYLLNPNDLTTIKTIPIIQDLFGYKPQHISVSNNGLLAITMDISSAPSVFSCCLYDIINEQEIFMTYKYWWSIDISPNGKYVVIRENGPIKLYQLNSLTLNYIGGIDQTIYTFNPLNEEQMYCFTSNEIQLYNCSNATLIQKYTHNFGMYNSHIDPTTGNILLANQLKVNVVDFDQNKLIASKDDVGLSETGNFHLYALFNNSLFSANGYKISLDK